MDLDQEPPPVDEDRDGHASEATGGDDCNDQERTVWARNFDNDAHFTVACGGTDCDDDNDGDLREDCGGDDCNDANPMVRGEPRDLDGDGHDRVACGGDDCDDEDPTVPSCEGRECGDGCGGSCPPGCPDDEYCGLSSGQCGPFAASCAEAHVADPGAPSGIYTLASAGAVPDELLDVYCDMENDGGGWTLVAKVHRFHGGPAADEPEAWFAMRLDPESLLDPTSWEADTSILASHGRDALEEMMAGATLARFTVIAEDDVSQRGTWFKELGPDLWSWFSQDLHEATMVCADVDMTASCSMGHVLGRTSGATLLEGMSLTAFGYRADGPIHMRLNGDAEPDASGVCSWTGNLEGNAWHDDVDEHWGNGLEIWVR